MRDSIDDLIEEVIVDAYGDSEHLWSFRQAFEDRARLPFRARVIGVDVEVTAVDFDGDERRGLAAVCRRAGERHTVSLLEITPTGPVALETRQLIEAYRRWWGVPPNLDVPEAAPKWEYPGFSSLDITVAEPLALNPMGDWDPEQEYWGEPGEEVHPMHKEVIRAGIRPCFEMEQVLPGVRPDDWDDDPIVHAAELHRAGHDREANRVLNDLIALDVRCIDAWGHLGLIAFDTRGPGPALEFYETGVGIAEHSLPVGFGGVLSWGMIDNRPFLRCLHGLAICAWRQRRWDDADAIFTARVWLDPWGSFDALACLEPVRSHQRWIR